MVAATDVVMALVMVVIAWTGASGRLRANPLAGMRLGQSTPAQWRASHHAALPWFLAGGAAALLSAAAALFLLLVVGASLTAALLAYLGAALAAVALALGAGAAARAIADTRRAEDRAHGSRA